MFKTLIILIAVINLTNSQEPPEVDASSILSGLSSASLECSLKFDRNFIAVNDDIAIAIESMLAEKENSERRDNDSTREPCDDEADSSEATDAPLLRRNLKRGRPGRRGDGNNRRVPRDDDSTKPPRDSDATREPKDVTREPCEGEDCQRGRKSRHDSTREPCDNDETDASEATEAPLLRRLLKRGRQGRLGDDNEYRISRDGDSTKPPRGSDATREPKDVTREPCEGDDCQRRHRERGRGNKGDSDATREPKTREPCEGDDCRRKDRGRGREDDSVATEEPETALRRVLGRKRGRQGALEASISDGIVDIEGVVGEVIFGEVDEELESVPLTMIVGETSFTCDVYLRRSGKVSCRATSDDGFRLRLGCEVVRDDIEV